MNQLTLRGKKLRDINAIPAKEILKNKARVCPPLSAICEIVDNIFDNYEENGSAHDLSISIVVRSDGDGEISIAENSGGVRANKLEPLVRLGVPYHSAKGSIGTWGEGFKVAAFSLGSEIEVVTHFPEEHPVVVHFDENWLSSSDWNVPLYSAAPGAVRRGSTIFRIRRLVHKIDWADIMRELSVIYGHKMQAIIDARRNVRIDFDVDGASTPIRARPLASTKSLRERLAYPPDFSPRQFSAKWSTEHGSVQCRLIVGLTPRHSGDTSGVYMFGNGRMFTRALRSKAVGYGEGGNAVLRDHPSCWRIHAYAFFDAEDGADIPWQAPLKDGVSETHPITTKFREMFKTAVSPYSRFAKVAKASEFLPFTQEWDEYSDAQKTETLFRSKAPAAAQQFKELPREIRDFSPPSEIENVRIDGVAGAESVSRLDQHAKYLRQIILKRDAGGSELEFDVLRALNPNAFSDEKRGHRRSKIETAPKVIKKTRISLELESAQAERVRSIFGASTVDEAVKAAVAFAIRHATAAKVGRRGRRG